MVQTKSVIKEIINKKGLAWDTIPEKTPFIINEYGLFKLKDFKEEEINDFYSGCDISYLVHTELFSVFYDVCLLKKSEESVTIRSYCTRNTPEEKYMQKTTLDDIPFLLPNLTNILEKEFNLDGIYANKKEKQVLDFGNGRISYFYKRGSYYVTNNYFSLNKSLLIEELSLLENYLNKILYLNNLFLTNRDFFEKYCTDILRIDVPKQKLKISEEVIKNINKDRTNLFHFSVEETCNLMRD